MSGLRKIIISGMSRQQLISFIKRKDKFYPGKEIHSHSDKQLRTIARNIDDKVQAERSQKRNSKNILSERDNVFLSKSASVKKTAVKSERKRF